MYPLPISMVTSAARPSAPSAAAGNEVAIEKKITVPPAAVDRIAPCSQPGTSTHTTVTSAGPPRALVTAAETATGSRASASATVSANPAPLSRSASASTGTIPAVRPEPARRAAASASEPLLPAPPSTATVGWWPAATYRWTTRSVSAGAPHTSKTASASSGSRSSGSTAAIDRANRIAWPAAGTCSLRPSHRASPSVTASGVRVSDTRVATRSPDGQAQRGTGTDRVHGADQHAARAGDRIVHLAATGDDLQHLGFDRGGVGLAGHGVLFRQLPEARGVEVEPLDPRSAPRPARSPAGCPAGTQPVAVHRPARRRGAARPGTPRPAGSGRRPNLAPGYRRTCDPLLR